MKSYQEYVKDLHVFVDGIVKKRSKSGELYLFAHSMGGAIGALFLEEYAGGLFQGGAQLADDGTEFWQCGGLGRWHCWRPGL